jgi:hypothetical protein
MEDVIVNFISKTKFWSRTASAIGVVGMSGLTVLGGVKPAEAASLTCGPGDHWVDVCPAGVDKFPISDAILDLWLMPPGESMQQITLKLSGPATVVRDNPVDALVGDADLGNVGIVDGHLGVIKTTLKEKFRGKLNGSRITLTGTGVGAIIEATESGINRPDLASSFFEVFAVIEGSFGRAKNMSVIRVDGDRWLTGLPPNKVIPPYPQDSFPPLPIPPNNECGADPLVNPLATIIYCGFEEVDFFAVDDDGNFRTDVNGNKIKVATLHSEQHVVEPVPEPLTILGASTALGFGVLLKKRSKKSKQQAVAS